MIRLLLGALEQAGVEIGGHRAPVQPAKAPNLDGDRELVHAALLELAKRRPAGDLLLVHDLRRMTPLDKLRFDTAVLALSRARLATLHHHDHPMALPEGERRQLVTDGHGTYYIGIAPRGR